MAIYTSFILALIQYSRQSCRQYNSWPVVFPLGRILDVDPQLYVYCLNESQFRMLVLILALVGSITGEAVLNKHNNNRKRGEISYS